MVRLFTPEEVAEMLSVNESTVRSWIRKGIMPGIKIGKFWRIAESELEKYIERKLEEGELVRG